jgi:hypothetical protein
MALTHGGSNKFLKTAEDIGRSAETSPRSFGLIA